MTQQNKDIDYDDVINCEVKKWYYVSKIMGQIIPGSFPYNTYQELWIEIMDDPTYKTKRSDD